MSTESPTATTTTGPGDGRALPTSRREILRRSLWGGAGLAVASIGALGPAVRAGASTGPQVSRRSRGPVFDVACLGDTFRVTFAAGATSSGDLRGSTFSVEGALYPEGTISGTGFDPGAVAPTGHWLCRGWFLIHPGRPEPHVVTTQEYVLGRIGPDRLFPPDQLASSGMEGAEDERQPAIRSVIGGTGRFAGATGEVVQHGLGTNTTTLATIGVPAPNFRFVFDLPAHFGHNRR